MKLLLITIAVLWPRFDQSTAGIATIRMTRTDRIVKRSTGHHDMPQTAHVTFISEDESMEIDVTAVKTLTAITNRHEVLSNDPQTERVYVDEEHNCQFLAKLTETDDLDPVTACVNGIGYNEVENGTYFTDEAPMDFHGDFINAPVRVKRSSEERGGATSNNSTGQMYLEVGIVVDYSTFSHREKFYGFEGAQDEIRTWYTFIMQAVKTRLEKGLVFTQTEPLKLCVNQFVVIEDIEDEIAIRGAKMKTNLFGFRTWVLNQLKEPSTSMIVQSDHFAFVIGERTSSILGMSFVSSVCADTSYHVSLSYDTQQANFAHILAHEIAHNLGALHDNSTANRCDEKDNYIMAPKCYPTYSQNQTSNNWHFSSCSTKRIQDTLKKKICLHNVPTNVSLNLGVRPGLSITKDQQCTSFYLDTSSFCKDKQITNGFRHLCAGIFCENAHGVCVRAIVPLEYTSCVEPPDKYHLCIRGRCRFRARSCRRDRRAECNKIKGKTTLKQARFRVRCKRNVKRYCRSLNQLRIKRNSTTAPT